MALTILATKLYIPPPRSKVVCRDRLLERLDEGLQRKLTLVSAPAGFGKTTLVSEWLAGCDRQNEAPLRAAWLSLDEGDSDPARFLTYLVAALRTVAPDVGERVMDAIQAAQPLPVEPILTELLNEIIAIPGNFVLVLDDYHLVDSSSIDRALTFLLEHLPPQMHLIITTREDPPLPLARLRARGQLTELRAGDLRFTPSEAADFINQAMGLNLSVEHIAALETRTEGWIAGLQLAALALQETLSMKAHPDAFIRAFAGDHRYIVDYLVEEVLQRQSEPVRLFLLQTAILDRLCGPLCDVVTGQEGGGARLEALERGNFFVVPLDDKRHWYRYHHLFAEVLHIHLKAKYPDQLALLHRRASEWYEQQGSTADAVRHSLAGQDFERAADLIELAVPAMSRSRQEIMAIGWLKALPDDVFQRRPVLNGHYGSLLLQSGQLEGVEARLGEAQRWLDAIADPGKPPPAPLAEMVVRDEAEFRRLPGSIATHRAGLALVTGDVTGTVKYARQALDLIPEEDHLGHGSTAALLGLVAWTNGELEEARRLYIESMSRLLKAGNTSDVLGCSIALADMNLGLGCLREAERALERGLQLGMQPGGPELALRGTADMHVGLSEIYRERNELDTAAQQLQKSQELGSFKELAQNPYRWRVAMARIREARGDLDGAIDLLNEAERVYFGDFSPNVRPIAAMRARVWIAQGRLGDAFDWVRAQGLSAADELSYLREFEHITLARLLLAKSANDQRDGSMLEAIGLLGRLLQAAEGGGRMGRTMEILVVLALAQQKLGDIPAGLALLERVLTLAEPEGYMRLFVDEGQPMARLLREAAARGILPDYTSRLLAGFEAKQAGSTADSMLPDLRKQPSTAPQPLIEPLSHRELEVLRLFKTDLMGPEIAAELVIALSTVRTHTKSIFSKLNVTNRRAAVKRAVELGLI